MNYTEEQEIALAECGICGCSEYDKIVPELLEFFDYVVSEEKLKWLEQRGKDFDTIFYLIANLLESNDVIEHGTSCRFPWLTPEKGKAIYETLQTIK